MKRKSIKCPCKASHKFNELTLVRTHWYTEPYGPTGGAYWNSGEWQYICPTRKKRVRIMFWTESRDGHEQLESAFKRLYGDVWAKVIDVYDDESGLPPISIPWSNSDEVCDKPVYYGLAKKVTTTTTRLVIA